MLGILKLFEKTRKIENRPKSKCLVYENNTKQPKIENPSKSIANHSAGYTKSIQNKHKSIKIDQNLGAGYMKIAQKNRKIQK